MNDIQKNEYWAEIAQKSGLFPDRTNIFQIKAILEIGRSIGLPPFQSLKHINFIKGKINMEVAVQLALFKKAGGKVLKMESSRTRAFTILEWNGEKYENEYTIEDAKNAELTSRETKDGKSYKGTYEKYPDVMLLWRCLGKWLKFLMPEIFMGLYGSDELATFLPDIEIKPEENLAADEEILKIIEKDEQCTEQLRFLNYTRRQVINIFKDFDGNLDRITEALNYEIEDRKKQQKEDDKIAISNEKKGKFDGYIDVSEAVKSYFNKKNDDNKVKEDDDLPFR